MLYICNDSVQDEAFAAKTVRTVSGNAKYRRRAGWKWILRGNCEYTERVQHLYIVVERKV